MKQVSLVILIVLTAIFLFQATQLAWRLHQGFRFASSSSPFQAANPEPRARILIVGDSTGVGTGASHPRDSVAGRLHDDYPCIAVINRSVNGARVEIERPVYSNSFDEEPSIQKGRHIWEQHRL